MRRLPTALVLIAACAARAAAAPGWVRVETANFVVFGEIGEKRTTDVAMEFERFREALIRILPRASMNAPTPTIVVLFASKKTFAPYRPLHEGKPVEIGGYFHGTEDSNLIVVAMDGYDNLHTVYHEYAHLVIANAVGFVPAWLNEGLAEFYGTFHVREGGRAATLGSPILHHMRLLNTTALMRMEELLQVEWAGAGDRDRRSLFYAQSWALVHMLLTHEPTRPRELAQYAALTTSGTDPVAAWTQVFGAMDAVGDVRAHVERRIQREFGVKFPTPLPNIRGAAVPVAAPDVHGMLGGILRWMAPADSAALMAPALSAQQPSALVRALEGLATIRNTGNGEVALLQAAADRSDWLAQYFAACGLARIGRTATEERAHTITEAAVGAIDAVLTAHPALPHALALKARVLSSDPARLDAAAEAIAQARRLAPGREDYAFIAFDVQMNRRDYRAAREAIGPVMARGALPGTREAARSLMVFAVEEERREAERREAAARAAAADAAAPAPGPDSSGFVPAYRDLGADERRVEGELHRVECGPKSTTLHVTVDGRALRFVGGRLDTIAFVTFRQDLKGEIACTRRSPPDRVLITFVSTKVKGSSGFPVAVEFVPVTPR